MPNAVHMEPYHVHVQLHKTAAAVRVHFCRRACACSALQTQHYREWQALRGWVEVGHCSPQPGRVHSPFHQGHRLRASGLGFRKAAPSCLALLEDAILVGKRNACLAWDCKVGTAWHVVQPCLLPFWGTVRATLQQVAQARPSCAVHHVGDLIPCHLQIPIPAPEPPLPPRFDAVDNLHKYTYLERNGGWLSRPLMDTHGADRDDGIEGFSVERSTIIRTGLSKRARVVGGLPLTWYANVKQDRT